jgi:hypothetical protein
MASESPRIARPRRSPRVPAFHPVPLRATRHGWTPERQAHFIGWLAETGSVSEACARVGMSRKGFCPLRGKPGGEGFAAAGVSTPVGESSCAPWRNWLKSAKFPYPERVSHENCETQM